MIDLRYGRDCLESLREMADCSVHCCVTSPPYWGLRSYLPSGHECKDREIGLEPTPDAYVARMVEVFREVRRVLRDDGTMFLNVGDSYAASTKGSGGKTNSTLNAKRDDNGDLADDRKSQPRMDALAKFDLDASGLKPKDLCLIPWRLAIALQQPWLKCKGCEAVAHQSQWGHWPNGRLICPSCEKSKGHDVDTPGWYVRSVICWAKKSPMPESVTDRPTNSWEPIFLMAKNQRYFYDAEAVRENMDAPPDIRQRASTFSKQSEVGQHGNGPAVICTIGRNQRNVWHLGPEPYANAHFATFPSEIPRRAILAGTSARGCCPLCLAPWVRVTENVPTGKKQKTGSNWDTGEGAHGSFHRNGRETKPADQDVMASKTIGWSPSCTCPPHDPIACRVLDPFSGSATTGQVAFSLGRDYIGLDLSTEYLELARERCGGLFCTQGV